MPKNIFFGGFLTVVNDEKGNIYISDYEENNIKKFDSAGNFLKIIGQQGQGPGDLDKPFSMTYAKDRLVIWELGNMRISILTPDGMFIKSVEFPLMEGWPRKVKSLPNGEIVIEREKRYLEEGSPQDCTIEIYTSGLQFKKTIFSQKVWRRKSVLKEMRTSIPTPFSPDVYWDIALDGKIIVGFSEEYKIEIFSSRGEKISSFSHPYEPVKVTEEDKNIFFKGIVKTKIKGRQMIENKGADSIILKHTEFPKYKPAFFNILIDWEGNILISPYKKGNNEMVRYFDAFDPKGKYIRNVQVVGDVGFPAGQRVCTGKNCFWVIKADEEGFESVVKYRISD